MDRNSKNTKAIFLAIERGYKISPKGEIINPSGIIIKGSWRGNGERNGRHIETLYNYFTLRENNKLYTCFVHQFVAYLKFGDEVFQNQCVRHLNDDYRDNSWDNIGLGSHSDNYHDMSKEKRSVLSLNSALKQRKYDYEEVRDFYNSCHSYNKCIEKFGMNGSELHHILNKTK